MSEPGEGAPPPEAGASNPTEASRNFVQSRTARRLHAATAVIGAISTIGFALSKNYPLAVSSLGVTIFNGALAFKRRS